MTSKKLVEGTGGAWKLRTALASCLLLSACAGPRSPWLLPDDEVETWVEDARYVEMPLRDSMRDPALEISGMAWRGQELWLLPQWPTRLDDGPAIFALERSQLTRALEGRADDLSVVRIPIDLQGINEEIDGWEGFESIVIDGETIWLTIEATTLSGETRGYLVQGAYLLAYGSVMVRPDTLQELPRLTDDWNHSWEALTLVDGEPVVFHEINDPRENENIQARRGAEASEVIAMPPIPWRVTAATEIFELDGQQCMGLMNYQYSGNRELGHAVDLDELEGTRGESHRGKLHAERVLTLCEDPQGDWVLNAEETLWFPLGVEGRNWEGLARFQEGFLAVTDRFPDTRLVWVGPAESEVEPSSSASSESAGAEEPAADSVENVGEGGAALEVETEADSGTEPAADSSDPMERPSGREGVPAATRPSEG